MLFSALSSAYNKDSRSFPLMPPWQFAPSNGMTYEQLMRMAHFLWASLRFCLVRSSHCVHILFTYNTTIWHWIEDHLKSRMKENESSSLPWITYQELKLDPTSWEGREPVSPNKAQPPRHIQSLMSLPPGLWHQGFHGCAQDKSAVPSLLSGKASLFLIRSRRPC